MIGNSGRLIAALVSVIFLLLLVTGTLAQVSNEIERVSVSSMGDQGNFTSFDPAISGNGRFIAFVSIASNLVPNDTNGYRDVFVHDRDTNQTELISVSSDEVQATHNSYDPPSISDDGRFVAFETAAGNLVSGDTNIASDIFVRDRQTGLTELVSLSNTGILADGGSGYPAISADGRFVVFRSGASNLVPGPVVGFGGQLYVRDRQAGLTERISVSSTGDQGNGGYYGSPSISADGRYIVFTSDSTNLVSNDTNNRQDIFLRDRQAGTTVRISVSNTGIQANNNSYSASITPDGRFVTFSSRATNLTPDDITASEDVFVHDRQTGLNEVISVSSAGVQGFSASVNPSISDDGRFVAFTSTALLVPGDVNHVRDIHVRDRQTGRTDLVSVSSTGVQSNTGSDFPSISADGSFIAFQSDANTLVPNDTNLFTDVFAARNVLSIPVVDLTEKSNYSYFTIDTPTLTWNRLSWALSYELQVDDTPSFTQPLEYSASVSGLQDTTTALSEGIHYWRVRGCTLPGTCGQWSQPERFEVDVP